MYKQAPEGSLQMHTPPLELSYGPETDAESAQKYYTIFRVFFHPDFAERQSSSAQLAWLYGYT